MVNKSEAKQFTFNFLFAAFV